MTLFPHIPHTQGIIEISLKTPKTHILYKKENFPTKNTKLIPHTTKKKLPGYYTQKFPFLSITLRFHILRNMLKALLQHSLLLRM